MSEIQSATDFNKVTECYGYDGGGPGASTILSRMLVYSGTMAMIKKGYFYQVQYLGPTHGSGPHGWTIPNGSATSKMTCLTN